MKRVAIASQRSGDSGSQAQNTNAYRTRVPQRTDGAGDAGSLAEIRSGDPLRPGQGNLRAMVYGAVYQHALTGAIIGSRVIAHPQNTVEIASGQNELALLLHFPEAQIDGKSGGHNDQGGADSG